MMTGWPSQRPRPKFANGDLVRMKAKALRTRWGKQHVGKAYTVERSEWRVKSLSVLTEHRVFGWEVICVDWADPEYPWSIEEDELTRVKVPK